MPGRRIGVLMYSASGVTGSILPGTFEARLSLDSSDPAPTDDQTAATTLYLLPYKGEYVNLYDGASTWQEFTLGSSGISIAIPATTDTNYDVFVYDSSGLTLELVAWSNDTTRATALTVVDGVYVKDGETTKRYAGTIRTTDSSGECEDSLAKRFVWNYYNRLPRAMVVVETTDSWTYTTAAFRAMNNSTANRLQFVIGVDEVFITAHMTQTLSSNTGTVTAYISIGLDSTSAKAANVLGSFAATTAGERTPMHAIYTGAPGIGFHYLQALEYGATNLFFHGDFGGSLFNSGIQGVIHA